MRKSLILCALILIPSTALAHKGARGHRHHKPRSHAKVTVVSPGVTIYAGSRPWSPRYIPPPRSGFSWAVGYYIGPRWTPGYWRPVGPAPAPTQIYVVGHWEGEQFVDGYWREDVYSGHDWTDGYYEDTGTYVEGGWVIVDEDGTEVIMVNDPVREDSEDSEDSEDHEIFEPEPIEGAETVIPMDPETMDLDE